MLQKLQMQPLPRAPKAQIEAFSLAQAPGQHVSLSSIAYQHISDLISRHRAAWPASSVQTHRRLSCMPEHDEEEEAKEADSLGQFLRLDRADNYAKPAVLHRNESLGYAELSSRVAVLCTRLKAVVSPSFVGICVHRSLALVVSLLASLQCKKAFIPLDPSFPKKRLRFIMEDSGLETLLLDEGSWAADHLQLTSFCGQMLVLDSGGRLLRQEGSQPSARGPDVKEGAAAAYAIYTSGSTGQPKGVVVSRPNLRLGPS